MTLYVVGLLNKMFSLYIHKKIHLILYQDTCYCENEENPNSIFNTMIASPKGNVFLFKAIRKIVKNVQNKYYGDSPLSPTGPELLYKVMLNNNYKVNIDMFHFEDGGYIIYKNTLVISTEYNEYNEERDLQYKNINTKRYDVLWNERRIYK